MDVNAAGKTVNGMKQSLAGTARLQLRDGAIKGINIAEVLRKAKTALSSQQAKAQAAETQKTDFSELSASFAIKNGVAHNEDLDVKAPLFRISGKGDIDIAHSKIDYVTKAAVVATTKGQGGKDLEQLAGLTVPVHLTGPLDNMKYDVDYSAVARDVAKSKIGETIKERLGQSLGSKPGEGQSGQGGSGLEKKLDKLKGLLGR
jgi:AsmA protein